MTADLIAWLVEATIATSLATILVLAARRPLRAACGAGAAYALWALVPVAAIAVLLPAVQVAALPAPMSMPVVSVAASTAVAGGTGASLPPLPALVLLAWCAGVLVAATAQARSQRRFVASLGTLRARADGLLQSDAVAGLPAVLGWRARIVVPADFDVRYDADERDLVLCHERIHQRRGDLPAVAVASLLRCLFWFNPLLHVAAARFRDDQELACDAVVLRRHPSARRRYGDALLKTQLADQPLPIGCHWFGSHPLKERIAMLKRPVPSNFRRLAGLLVAFAAVSTGGAFAWAAQPSGEVPAGKIGVEMDVRIDGGDTIPLAAVLSPGQPGTFEFDAGGDHWRIDAIVDTTADGHFDFTSKISRDGEAVAEPRLLFGDTAASIAVGEERPDGSFDGIAIDVRAKAGLAPIPSETAAGLPAPAYPPVALANGEGGVVMLHLRVGEDGRVRESRYAADGSTVGESSSLVQAARDAAMQWQLAPAMKDGRAVETWVQVPIRFEPDGG